MSEIKKVPKRGISTYCFYPMMDVNMELEDIFMHMEDMGAPGLEILADGIIEGYPHPSNKWLDKWFSLVENMVTGWSLALYQAVKLRLKNRWSS